MRVWYPCPYPPVTLRPSIRELVQKQRQRNRHNPLIRRQLVARGVMVQAPASLKQVLDVIHPIQVQYSLTPQQIMVCSTPDSDLLYYAVVPESDQEYHDRLSKLATSDAFPQPSND